MTSKKTVKAQNELTGEVEGAISWLKSLKQERAAAKHVSFLIKKLEPEIKQEKERERKDQGEGRYLTLVDELQRTLLASLAVMKKRGFTAGSIQLTSKLCGVFMQGENKLKECVSALIKTSGGRSSELPMDDVCQIIRRVIDKVEPLTIKFAQDKNDAILQVSKEWNLQNKRARLGKLCFSSAIGLGREVAGWDEIEMIGCCLRDMLKHLELGSAILSGKPSLIDKKSSMDTVVREELSNDVWNFVCVELNELNKAEKPVAKRQTARR
jgi:hypothetical protein